MRWVLIFAFILALCSGCKTTSKVQREIVTEYVELHDTIRDVTVQIVRDSIYLHDSIVVIQDTTGKVIYKEKYVYRDLWHDGETKVVHDSIVVYKDKSESNKDSKEVVEKRNFWTGYWKAMVLIILAVAIVLRFMYWSETRK